jgi:hypothetical protein
MAEAAGTGWGGAYYAVHAIPTKPATALSTHVFSTTNAVAAGSLEWDYIEYEDICLSNQNNAALGACYTIQLSIPYGSEYLPSLNFEDAWFVEDAVGVSGGSPSSSTSTTFVPSMSHENRSAPCPYMMIKNVSFGLLCVEESGSYGNITFYWRNATWMGQVPYTNIAEFNKAQNAALNMTKIGVCRFPLTTVYNASSPFEEYITSLTGVPTVSPTAEPTGPPSPTASPTPLPSSIPVPLPTALPTILTAAPTPVPTIQTTPAPTKAPVTHYVRNFSCFRDCDYYPGDHLFQLMKSDACGFLMSDAFNPCGTFAISTASCPLNPCLSSCAIEDYCYYGAGAAAYCPALMWNKNKDNSTAVAIMNACIASMYAARISGSGGGGLSGNGTDTGSGASAGGQDAVNSDMASKHLPITLIVVISGNDNHAAI